MVIHIVGTEHSFTYNASKERYRGIFDNGSTFASHSHSDLVSSLLDKKIPMEEPAVVPLWNSNSGTVDMNRRTQTARLFLGKAGIIHDLWPRRIVFGLSIHGEALSSESRFFSVHVARKQCSRFLQAQKVGVDRFEGRESTTAAADAFQAEAGSHDALLCSEELLSTRGLPMADQEVTNLYNITIFSTFNRLPLTTDESPSSSLACVVADLDGNELTPEFIEYYKSILDVPEIEQHADPSIAIPKILFVLRYEESRALLLLEMPRGTSGDSPWQIPDLESGLDFHDEVGRIREAYSLGVAETFETRLGLTSDYIFYGTDGCYMWACPALKIAVHGYDKELVRLCARTQVLFIKSLLDMGIDLSGAATSVLGSFEENPAKLGLSPDSEPETP